MRLKTTGLFALATILLAGMGSSANAQSAICYDLETRLASLQRGGGVSNSGRSKGSARAIQKLKKKIAGAQASARKAGCRSGGIRLFQKRECRSRNSSIKQMRRNLQSLQRKGGRSTASRSQRNVNRQKQELIVALGRHRCGTQYERAAAKYDGQRGLFGRKKVVLDGFNEPKVRSYRTVCVRTCDGFFFPISHSTTSRAFARDEAVCKSKFPNTDVSLFYHPRGSTNAMERARSIDGQSYTAMPYAFGYQKKYDATCKFDRSLLRQTAGIVAKTAYSAQNKRVAGLKFGQNGPVPEPRPEIGLDPETLMNVAGYLRPKALPLPAELIADPQIKDGQRVRLVGPEVFYGQSTAEVLSSPARTRVQ
ncbi:MAG: DUF2865 domain-containing protein [Hyphomicrobiales bacterium]